MLARAENRIQPNGTVKSQYLCLCECGNTKIIQAQSLRKGVTKSCGCLAKQIASLTHKKTNEFIFDNNIAIGTTTNTQEKFYFDIEDYDMVNRFAWFSYNGYVTTNNYNLLEGYPRLLKLHRLVMKENDPKKIIDHINHNTLDNRKINLRIVTSQQNSMNHKIFRNNSSGITGVRYSSLNNKWLARITYNYKDILLGEFDDFEDAVIARKNAEIKYYKEFSYENSMKFMEDKTYK